MSQYDPDDIDDLDDLDEDEATGPQVVWTLDLDDAEELWHYLHHHRPGGYQHVHDGLWEAISLARREAENPSA